MTILVTGGGGFLGEAIVDRLLERGLAVRSYARGSYPDLAAKGVDVRQGDLADGPSVLAAAQGCEAVFHVAAKTGVHGAAAAFRSANLTGTRNVLAACSAHGIRQLIYTSTPSVIHGGGDVSRVDESVTYPERWSSPYPETKARAERLVLAANGPDLATVALRPHLVWGPGDRQLVPAIIERARRGRLFLVGDGLNTVDSTYISNAADAHLLAYDRLEPGSPIGGRAYFIAQGEPMPMRDLIATMLEAAGLTVELRSVPVGVAMAAGAGLDVLYRWLPLPGEQPLSRFLVEQLATDHWYDLTAARRDLGYDPRISFAEGVAHLAAWYEEQRQ